MNDKVSFVCPEKEDYKQNVEDLLRQDVLWYYGSDEIERLMSHGMSREEAEQYSQKGRVLAEYFSEHKEDVCYTWFRGKTITFGRKGGGQV